MSKAREQGLGARGKGEDRHELEEDLYFISNKEPVMSEQFKKNLKDKLFEPNGKSAKKELVKKKWYANWHIYAGAAAACFILFTGFSLTNSLFSSSQNETPSGLAPNSVVSGDSSSASARTEVEDESITNMNFSAPVGATGSDDLSENYAVDKQAEERDVTNTIDGNGDDVITGQTQKIIKNATYVLIAETPASQAQYLIDVATNHYQGFVQDSTVSSSEKKNKNGKTKTVETAHLVIRVPVESFDDFRNEIKKGEEVEIISEQLSGDDVTSQYVDLDARLKNLQVEEEQLQTLMDRATTIDEILKVRSSLVSTRSQIEQLTAQLKSLDSKVSYSTFSLTIRQPDTEEPEPEGEKWSLRTVLKEAWDNLIEDYQNLVEDVVDIGVQSLILLPLLLALLFAVLLAKALSKRKKS